MALSNENYSRIMNDYEKRRGAHIAEAQALKERFLTDNPEVRALENRIAALCVEQTMAALDGRTQEADSISLEIADIYRQLDRIYSEHGITAAEFEPHFDCPDCEDTGYILQADNTRRKCHCLRERETEILYNLSGMRELLATNNFDHIRTDHLTGEDLEHFDNAVALCHKFVEEFDSDYHNLIFYGTVGSGKSFLSCCIAAELLKKHYSVIYLSSQQLFDILSQYQFGNNETKSAVSELNESIGTCDLLIIDDLGTELTNAFVGSALFAVMTKRSLLNRRTIVSTNLSLIEIRDRYSDRIFSRMSGDYIFVKLSGPDARRILRK